MTVDQVQQILVNLLLELPAELRPLMGSVAGSAATTMSLWTPIVVVAWVVILGACISTMVDWTAG